MYKFPILTFIFILPAVSGSGVGNCQNFTENGAVLLAESFNSFSHNWKEIDVKGVETGGEYRVSDGQLKLNVATGAGWYGVYHEKSVSGHFYAEVEFDREVGCGLVLLKEKESKPDPDNFTSLWVDTNEAGKVVVEVRDRQNGVDSVFDASGKMAQRRYRAVLDNERSVPFTSTDKKIRIFRDGPAGFFHFYYAVKKEIRGEWAQGWMELAPGPDWGEGEQNFFVALCVDSAEPAAFDNLRVVQKPTEDQDDRQTGFAETRRDYNWSGFSGEALVITFGEEFAFRQSDKKFVFWTAMNYIPAWHLNNQLLFTYEFLETWGGDSPGCFEPMSDRLLRWSNVELVENNEVRKVVHWHYVMCNPDYKVPNDSVGTQLPEGDEYWTFYRDGTVLRHIEYRPKLDGTFRKVHELNELIAVAGSLSRPVDHTAEPALSVLNLQGAVQHYHPNKDYDGACNQWDQVILAGHFKTEPDAFNVFSCCADTPETFSYYPIKFELTWHSHRHTLAHWPVSMEPYQKADATGGTFMAQPMHTCLISGSVYEGIDWEDHFWRDENGRKYRQWTSLVGLNEPGDVEGLRDKTASWLYPGKVAMLGDSYRFEGIDYRRREFVFEKVTDKNRCEFSIVPEQKSRVLINPVFKIEHWSGGSVRVKLNGQELQRGKDFRLAYVSEGAIVWIKGRFEGETRWEIREH